MVSKDHVLLCNTVHEEDLMRSLDHLHKVEEEGMLVLPKEGDEAVEDDTVTPLGSTRGTLSTP